VISGFLDESEMIWVIVGDGTSQFDRRGTAMAREEGAKRTGQN
jgi:hypothetical protein